MKRRLREELRRAQRYFESMDTQIIRDIQSQDSGAFRRWGSRPLATGHGRVQFDVDGERIQGKVVIQVNPETGMYSVEFWKKTRNPFAHGGVTMAGKVSELTIDELVKTVSSWVG